MTSGSGTLTNLTGNYMGSLKIMHLNFTSSKNLSIIIINTDLNNFMTTTKSNNINILQTKIVHESPLTTETIIIHMTETL